MGYATQVVTSFNILHLMIIVGSVGCAAFAVREATGHSITAMRLFMPPMLAGGTAVILLLMAAGEPMLLQIWLGALVVGLAIGAYRGSTMVMRLVDSEGGTPLSVWLWFRLAGPAGPWVASHRWWQRSTRS